MMKKRPGCEQGTDLHEIEVEHSEDLANFMQISEMDLIWDLNDVSNVRYP